MNSLPITLKLEGRTCLVVGGGNIALQKVQVLARAGACLRVVAPGIGAGIRKLAQQVEEGEMRIELIERAFRESDLDGAGLVIAATDDAELNHEIYALARRRGVLANVVDDPEYCDFLFPSVLRRGDLSVAVGTNGSSPSLARRVREGLEAGFAINGGELLERVRVLRARVKGGLICSGARRAVNELAARAWLLARETGAEAGVGKIEQLAAELMARQQHEVRHEQQGFFAAAQHKAHAHQHAPMGSITLVGAGPGDPELITLAGARALAEADVVIYDRLANVELLRHAPQAEHILLGKAPGEQHAVTQAKINEALVEHARAGKRVVRLKGGDPFVFGRGGEEVEAARAAGIAVRVIPGITAALGAAAAAQIPLTHRGVAGSVTLVTGSGALGEGSDATQSEGQPDWSTLARLNGTLAVYMGATRAGEIALRLIEAGRSVDEPVAVIQQATLPGQEIVRGTLGELAAETLPCAAPALLIIGDVARYAAQVVELAAQCLAGE